MYMICICLDHFPENLNTEYISLLAAGLHYILQLVSVCPSFCLFPKHIQWFILSSSYAALPCWHGAAVFDQEPPSSFVLVSQPPCYTLLHHTSLYTLHPLSPWPTSSLSSLHYHVHHSSPHVVFIPSHSACIPLQLSCTLGDIHCPSHSSQPFISDFIHISFFV